MENVYSKDVISKKTRHIDIPFRLIRGNHFLSKDEKDEVLEKKMDKEVFMCRLKRLFLLYI